MYKTFELLSKAYEHMFQGLKWEISLGERKKTAPTRFISQGQDDIGCFFET